MASPAAEHRQSDPPPHGSARPNPCGHGADFGHAEPRQRSSWGQEGATPILAADKWISDLQFFDYLSLLQVFRIENGTSCAHGCRDDQSIID